MTSRSCARLSVKSCFTRTAPPWNVMIATRSAGAICVSMYLLRRGVGAHQIGGRHRRQIEVQDQQPAVAVAECRRAAEPRSAPGSPDGDSGRAGGRRAARGVGGAPRRPRRRQPLELDEAIVCGSPSSVTVKSFAVSPSIGLPSLSLTVTVSTINRVPLRKTGGVGCWA